MLFTSDRKQSRAQYWPVALDVALRTSKSHLHCLRMSAGLSLTEERGNVRWQR